MNWAKENKFLTGYGVVMLIGVGVLGFKVYSASSAYDDANDRFAAQASAYKNLRSAAPYPNKENLAVLDAQKKEAAGVISAFQASLAKREFPLVPMAPEAFQDALKKAVTEVRDRSKVAGVELPKDKFYLGFNRYETAPPDKNASSLLGRDLKAIQWVIDQLVATPILSLKDIKRAEIPEEKGIAAAASRPGPNPAGGNPPGGAGRSPANLVSSHAFDITFNSKQHQLAKVLNTIVSPGAPQFYIIRQIKIGNSNPKAPPRATPTPDLTAPVVPGAPGPLPGAAPVAPVVAPAPAAPSIQTPTTIASLVGEETIDTTLHLEIVDFAEPPATATPAPAAAK